MTEPHDGAQRLAVAPADLRRTCDPGGFAFETTAELPPNTGLVGQPRALASLDLSLAVAAPGYHLYVAGPLGTGKTTLTHQRIQTHATAQPVPSDWVYVANFTDPNRPLALSLPPGQGTHLASAMRELVTACRREIARTFEGETYEQRRQALHQEFEERRRALSEALEQAATERHFVLQPSPMGIMAVPTMHGKPMSREDFERLTEAERGPIETAGEELTALIERYLADNRRLAKQATEQLRALDQEIARFVISPLVDDVREVIDGVPAVQTYLDQVQTDLLDHLGLFQSSEGQQATANPIAQLIPESDIFARYEVNVVVDNHDLTGAPVVAEHNPTFYNLCGRIDYTARLGGMVTDHRHIKAGSILRANGGYLLVHARDLLVAPFAWEALKRVLRTGQAMIENLGDQYSAVPTATLKPEPIPVAPRVVIIGDRTIYQLLYTLDDDFRKLFRVRADFDSVMERTPEAELSYASFLAGQHQSGAVLPFDRGGVAAVIDHGSRMAEHQQKLCTCFHEVLGLAIEASHWATVDSRSVVTAGDVERAIEQRSFRTSLIEDNLYQLVTDGTVLITVAGSAIGQINGLSVINVGDTTFGHPSRITARVAPGGDGVVNIERETKQSGPTHSKGVLTLAGYLLGQYAAEAPLAISASLGFEQLYGGVDGDSASAAELVALLSALAELPIRQDLAVTGSINQHGHVQAIGGVNEKIEGFFTICQRQGLSGTQGVVIPRANLSHLMLRPAVIEAVNQGQFHLYAIDLLDDLLELMTMLPAGQRGHDGQFPSTTVHGRVAARLRAFGSRLAAMRELTTSNGRRPVAADEVASDALRPL